MKQYLTDYEGLPAVATIHPTKVTLTDGEVAYQGDQPLAWAINSLAQRGVVLVHPGAYTVGKIGHTVGGHYRGLGRPRIAAPGSDTIAMVTPEAEAKQPILFEGFDIEVGDRAGFVTYDDGKPGTSYRADWSGCRFMGGYDHATGVGRATKWGAIPHRWSGFFDRCTFDDIAKEHGIYAHTIEGDVFVSGCRFRRCGRTGFQHVGREHESGFADHRITITDSRFDDCGLNDGGSHITAQGVAEVVVRRVRSTIGLDAEFAAAYLARRSDKKRFGTGHFVNWSEKTGSNPNFNAPSRGVWLDDFAAVTAEGCGNAAAIQVLNSKGLVLSGDLIVHSGGPWNRALATNAAVDASALTSAEIRGALELTGAAA